MTEKLTAIIALSIIVTYLWRAGGVLIASRIAPNGAVLEWLGCVAYAMLAGLMARVMIYPVGMLAETSLLVRSLSMLAGFVFFFAFERNFFAGTLVAIIAFYGLLML